MDAIEAIIDNAQEAFGTDPHLVSVRPVYKFGDAMRKQALSKVRVKVQPGGHVAHLRVHVQETERMLVLLSAMSSTALGGSDQFRDGSCDLS